MVESAQRRRQWAGRVVAGVLGVDGVAHLYWATGMTWPAGDQEALSRAVIGAEVSFAPSVVVPLALLLFGAASGVLAYAYGVGGRVSRAVACAVAGGLVVRGLAGVAWAGGMGEGAGPVFHWLNLVVYTPVCLGLGWLVARWIVLPRREASVR
ncbi:DUF3995 domain-containing protein [Streptomyces sp. NPDC050418]|uniref:DUF3995 domain-containing protein n=1 Tax=Streptomyces sp. NPDC050418 TaxID=3365612 RepID=UPI0037B1461F